MYSTIKTVWCDSFKNVACVFKVFTVPIINKHCVKTYKILFKSVLLQLNF